MKSIMLDIETWGTTPGSALLAIGAVAFDPMGGELGSKYYSVINLQSCLTAGLTMDETTVDWWANQSLEAQAVLREEPTAPDLAPVLDGLEEYFKVVGPGPNDVKVWGNGANFDQPLVEAAFRALGRQAPWRHFHVLCYRTIRSLQPRMRPTPTGVAHNALDDAVSQARFMQQVVAASGVTL